MIWVFTQILFKTFRASGDDDDVTTLAPELEEENVTEESAENDIEVTTEMVEEDSLVPTTAPTIEPISALPITTTSSDTYILPVPDKVVIAAAATVSQDKEPQNLNLNARDKSPNSDSNPESEGEPQSSDIAAESSVSDTESLVETQSNEAVDESSVGAQSGDSISNAIVVPDILNTNTSTASQIITVLSNATAEARQLATGISLL